MILLWIILVDAMICGTVGALIAQSKNRSPADGAILGGLLGIIGIFIMACLSKLPEGERSTPTAHGPVPPVNRAEFARHMANAKQSAADGRDAVVDLSKAFANAGNDHAALTEVLTVATGFAETLPKSWNARSMAEALAESAKARLSTAAESPVIEPAPSEPDAGSPRNVAVDDAVQLARRRYASGELSREEFLQLERDLGSTR
jgi:hypothetical protein